MTTQTSTTGDRLVIRQELPSFGVHFSKAHLLRLEKEGRFPRRIQVSAQRVAWLESELRNWIRERAEGRKAA
jgi:prophage regulatory protein